MAWLEVERNCCKTRASLPLKLTENPNVTRYKWVHPSEER